MSWPDLHPETLQRVGWTLVHFTWQATVVAAVLKATLWACRAQSAKLRYALACAAMLVMTALPALTFALNWGSDGGPVRGANFTTAERKTSRSIEQINQATQTGSSESAIQRLVRYAASILHPLLTPIAYAWLAGLALLMVRYAVQWATLSRRLGIRPISSAELLATLGELSQRNSLTRIRFAASEKLDSPATIGFWRPLVLLPVSAVTGLPQEMIVALVAHELAHIRRHDYLVNLLQIVMEHLLFFHPAVWWVSARIREEREHCCDDIASAAVGPTAYARALTRIEEWRHEQQALVLAAADGSLMSRVKRLVIGRSPVSTAGAIVSTAITCVVLLSASTLFGRTLQPNELWWQVQQARPITAVVYDALGVESDSTAFLDALAEAAVHEKPTDDQIERVVEALSHGARHDALARAALPTISITDVWSYDRAPGWRYGSSKNRLLLTERLWIRAARMVDADPARARRYAIASLMLAGQEAVLTGGRLVGRLDNDPKFSEVAQISQRQRERLRLALLAEMDVSGQYAPLLSTVREAIDQRLRFPDAPQKLSLEECASRIRRCGQFGEKDRFHVQRNLARLVWMLRECDPGLAVSVAADLRRHHYGEHWQRWITEAIETPTHYVVIVPVPGPSTKPAIAAN